jgi:Transposase DDE domain group 1
VVLDMDSTEIPVYREQGQSASNGHFESTCYHPLLLFNREGDCLAAKLQPGNVHSAEGWEELLVPDIERQQRQGRRGGLPRRRRHVPSWSCTRRWKNGR